MLISVIIPCFNEENVIIESHKRISKILGGLPDTSYELIFINDGSKDCTSQILKKLAENDSNVKIISLSRNFGHQAAVSAGIKHCKGDLAVIIDADMQDPPEIIPDMISLLKETGSNVIYGIRKRRKGESLLKLTSAKFFYRILNALSETPLPVDSGDFRIIDKKIISVFNSLNENNKYIRGLVSWMGFKQTPFYYEREPRFAGSSKYSLRKMLHVASTGIFYFSKKPLKIATSIGFITVLAGLILFIWILYNKIKNPQYLVSGWTSIILVVIFFSGVQLLTIGVLGQYIGSLFDEVKKRPEFIISETINL